MDLKTDYLSLSPNILITCFTASLILCASIVVYRLILHPLSNFPGPQLAAASSLYRIYHEMIRDGEWLAQVEHLHTKYGSHAIALPSSISDIYALQVPWFA